VRGRVLAMHYSHKDARSQRAHTIPPRSIRLRIADSAASRLFRPRPFTLSVAGYIAAEPVYASSVAGAIDEPRPAGIARSEPKQNTVVSRRSPGD
jgi:hypothetical protein